MGRTIMLLTIKDVSAQLQIARSTVYKLVAEGKLPQPIRVNKNIRWRASAIEPYLAKLENEARSLAEVKNRDTA